MPSPLPKKRAPLQFDEPQADPSPAPPEDDYLDAPSPDWYRTIEDARAYWSARLSDRNPSQRQRAAVALKEVERFRKLVPPGSEQFAGEILEVGRRLGLLPFLDRMREGHVAREQRRQAGARAADVRRENASRDDALILAAVQKYRGKHPRASQRAMAQHLLADANELEECRLPGRYLSKFADFADADDRRRKQAIDAVRMRIRAILLR